MSYTHRGLRPSREKLMIAHQNTNSTTHFECSTTCGCKGNKIEGIKVYVTMKQPWVCITKMRSFGIVLLRQLRFNWYLDRHLINNVDINRTIWIFYVQVGNSGDGGRNEKSQWKKIRRANPMRLCTVPYLHGVSGYESFVPDFLSSNHELKNTNSG